MNDLLNFSHKMRKNHTLFEKKLQSFHFQKSTIKKPFFIVCFVKRRHLLYTQNVAHINESIHITNTNACKYWLKASEKTLHHTNKY